MSWQDILKLQRRMRSHLHNDTGGGDFSSPADREMYEKDKKFMPTQSIMDEGLEMLRSGLEKIHKEAVETQWYSHANSRWAFVDTPKVSVRVIFMIQSNDYLALHMQTHSRSKAVDAIMQEVGEFYKNKQPKMLDYINR